MSTLNVNRVVDASGGVLAPISSVMRNRLINSAMVIDQRNAGASVTPTTNVYALDRWNMLASVSSKFSVQQVADAPAGFVNSMRFTSLSAYTPAASDIIGFDQRIEGFNIADLNWGTANAKAVTVSFWVKSSLTGTFGGNLRPQSNTPNYPFTYSISSANTWEFKTVSVAAPTTGTFPNTNGSGVILSFGLGVGSTFNGTADGTWKAGDFISATGTVNLVATNAATLNITGVQLEVGTQATSFEYRQYQQELALCQRYYQKLGTGTVQDIIIGSGISATSTVGTLYVKYDAPMRTPPTATQSNLVVTDAVNYNAVVTSITINAALSSCRLAATCSGGGMTQYRPALLSQTVSGTGFLDLSAEL